ncbi:MAG: 6-phosphofructokinase [Planctomycetota bacterium JB042]
MVDTPRGNAVIGQSGGPTVVINQSLVGLVRAAAGVDAIEHVYGARHGVKGILDEEFVDLGREDAATLDAVAATPAAALGSVRKKPTEEECSRILDVFEAHDVRYFFYLGGNDSAETAHIVEGLAEEKGYDIRLFHVPKTIDNDLRVTDHCPGFGSAAKFVASAVMGDDLDNRSIQGIKIDVVMGRHAGFLTAATALARRHPDDGPHLIYVPEVAFDVDRFLDDVGATVERIGRCVVAVSEGIHDADGELIVKSGERDSHGNVQLSGSGALGDLLAARVRGRFGSSTRVRADTFGYLQRSFPGFASEVDADEARRVGESAVEAATSGDHASGSIALRRLDGPEYAVDCFVTPLDTVARVTKSLDPAFLNEAGNDVTDAWLDYVRPLAGALPVVGRFAGHPVEKRLGR